MSSRCHWRQCRFGRAQAPGRGGLMGVGATWFCVSFTQFGWAGFVHCCSERRCCQIVNLSCLFLSILLPSRFPLLLFLLLTLLPLAAFDEKDFRRWAAGSPLCAPLVDGPRSLPPSLAAPQRLPDRDYTVRADNVQKAPSGVAVKDMEGQTARVSFLKESPKPFLSFS